MSWTVEPTTEELQVLLEVAVIYRDAQFFDHARDICRGVRSLKPASEVPETLLGTICFHQGQFDQARRHYERSLERDPENAWTLAHLGELELFTLDKDAARVTLRRAIDLDPRGEAGQMAENLLELVEAARFEGKGTE